MSGAPPPAALLLLELVEALAKDLRAVSSKKAPGVAKALGDVRAARDKLQEDISKCSGRHKGSLPPQILESSPDMYQRALIQPYFIDWGSIQNGKHIPTLLRLSLFLLTNKMLNGREAFPDFKNPKGYRPENLLSQVGMEVLNYPHSVQTSASIKMEFITYTFSLGFGEEVDGPLYIRIMQFLFHEYNLRLSNKKVKIPLYYRQINSASKDLKILSCMVDVVRTGTTKIDNSSRLCSVQLISFLVSYAKTILIDHFSRKDFLPSDGSLPTLEFSETNGLVDDVGELQLNDHIPTSVSPKVNHLAMTHLLIIILQLIIEILCTIPPHQLLLVSGDSKVKKIADAHGRLAISEFIFAAKILGLLKLITKDCIAQLKLNQSIMRCSFIIFEKIFQLWGNLPVGGKNKVYFHPLASVYRDILCSLVEFSTNKKNRLLELEALSSICRLIGGMDHSHQVKLIKSKHRKEMPSIDVIATKAYSDAMFHYNMIDITSIDQHVPGSALAKLLINFDGDMFGIGLFDKFLRLYWDPKFYRNQENYTYNDKTKAMNGAQSNEFIDENTDELAKCDEDFLSLFDSGRLSTFLGGVIHVSSSPIKTFRAKSPHPIFYSRESDHGHFSCVQLETDLVSEICNYAATQPTAYQNFTFDTPSLLVMEREGTIFAGPVTSIFSPDKNSETKNRTLPFASSHFTFFSIRSLRLYTVVTILNSLACLCEHVRAANREKTSEDVAYEDSNDVNRRYYLTSEKFAKIKEQKKLLKDIVGLLGRERYEDLFDLLDEKKVDIEGIIEKDEQSVAKMFLDLSNYRPSLLDVGLKIKDVGDILTNDKTWEVCPNKNINNSEILNNFLLRLTIKNENHFTLDSFSSSEGAEHDNDFFECSDIGADFGVISDAGIIGSEDNENLCANSIELSGFDTNTNEPSKENEKDENNKIINTENGGEKIDSVPINGIPIITEMSEQSDSAVISISEEVFGVTNSSALLQPPCNCGLTTQETQNSSYSYDEEKINSDKSLAIMPASSKAAVGKSSHITNTNTITNNDNANPGSSSPPGKSFRKLTIDTSQDYQTISPGSSKLLPFSASVSSQILSQKSQSRQVSAGTTTAKMVLGLIYALFTRIDVPGESQKIDRLMEQATEIDAEFRLLDLKSKADLDSLDNSHECFSNSGSNGKERSKTELILKNYQDIVYPLLFSLVMLNTDLHSVSIKPENKMKLSQFISNTQALKTNLTDDDVAGVLGILSDENLTVMYNHIKSHEMVNSEIKDLKEGNGSCLVWKKLNNKDWRLINTCREKGEVPVDGVLDEILEIDRDCGLLGIGSSKLQTYVDGCWKNGLDSDDLTDRNSLPAVIIDQPHILSLIFDTNYLAAEPENIFIQHNLLSSILNQIGCDLLFFAQTLLGLQKEVRYQRDVPKYQYVFSRPGDNIDPAIILESYNIHTTPFPFDIAIMEINLITSLLKLAKFSPVGYFDSLVPKLFDSICSKEGWGKYSDGYSRLSPILGTKPISTFTLLLFVLINHIYFKTLELRQKREKMKNEGLNTDFDQDEEYGFYCDEALLYTDDILCFVQRNYEMFLLSSQYIGESLSMLLNNNYTSDEKIARPNNILFSIIADGKDERIKTRTIDLIRHVPLQANLNIQTINALNIYMIVLRFYNTPSIVNKKSPNSNSVATSNSVLSNSVINTYTRGPSFYNIDLDLVSDDPIYTDNIKMVLFGETFVSQEISNRIVRENYFAIDAASHLLKFPHASFYNNQILIFPLVETILFGTTRRSIRALRTFLHVAETMICQLETCDVTSIVLHTSCFRSCRLWNSDEELRYSLINEDGSPEGEKLLSFISSNKDITSLFTEKRFFEKFCAAYGDEKQVEIGSDSVNISTSDKKLNVTIEQFGKNSAMKYLRGYKSGREVSWDLGIFSIIFYASFVNHIKPLGEVVRIVTELSSYIVKFHYTSTNSFLKKKTKQEILIYDKIYNAVMIPMLFAMTNAVARIGRLGKDKKDANHDKIQVILEDVSDFIMQAFPNSVEPIDTDNFITNNVITDLSLTTLVGELAAIAQSIPNKPFSTSISKLPNIVYDLIKKSKAESSIESHQQVEFPPLYLIPNLIKSELQTEGEQNTGENRPSSPLMKTITRSFNNSRSVSNISSISENPNYSSLSDKNIECIFSNRCWSKSLGLTFSTATEIIISEISQAGRSKLMQTLADANENRDLAPLLGESYFTVTTTYDSVFLSALDVTLETAKKQNTLQNGSFEMLYDVVLKVIEAVEIGDVNPDEKEAKIFYSDVSILTEFISRMSKTFIFTETKKTSLFTKCADGVSYKCLKMPFSLLSSLEYILWEKHEEDTKRQYMSEKYSELLVNKVLNPIFDYSFGYCNIYPNVICPNNTSSHSFITSHIEDIAVDVQYIIRTVILILISSRLSKCFHNKILCEFLEVMNKHKMLTFFAVELGMASINAVIVNNPLLNDGLYEKIVDTLEKTTDKLIEYVNVDMSQEEIRKYVLFIQPSHVLIVYPKYILEISKWSKNPNLRIKLFNMLKRIIISSKILGESTKSYSGSGNGSNVPLETVVFKCYYKLAKLIMEDMNDGKISGEMNEILSDNVLEMLVKEHFVDVMVRHISSSNSRWISGTKQSEIEKNVSDIIVNYDLNVISGLYEITSNKNKQDLMTLIFDNMVNVGTNYFNKARRAKSTYVSNCSGAYSKLMNKLLSKKPNEHCDTSKLERYMKRQ